MKLLDRLADAESGLFLNAPAGTGLGIAEEVRDAGKAVAILDQPDNMGAAIEQLASQLGVPAGHTISATLEAASALVGEPIYVLVEQAERFERSAVTFALKAARDALNSSAFFGLRAIFISDNRAVLGRMTCLESAAFFFAPVIDLIRDDLMSREAARRRALWSLKDEPRRQSAEETLLRIWRLDQRHPIGEAAGWSLEQIRGQVPIHVENGHPHYVCLSEIPEPWATRFMVASRGSTRSMLGYYADDWEHFLSLWEREQDRVEDLAELAIERLVTNGSRAAQARSQAKLAELGIDPADLQTWATEMVGQGSWPEGDFVEAFRAWKLKRTSNADGD
ncbi:MAG: hypothetical protein Q8R10_19980 [Pseudomonas sp.]|uniref:hypothetical protein n=1 Tax=Pseudomonas sp. TaxID=306 RepID=UPI002732A98D|nr:hypothetical protein [Pseudomonas sp.]MDP3848703.1 hypothetical protein [Pseudomonas sp.]